MSEEKHFMLRPIVAALVLLFLCTFLISCTNPNANSDSNQANYSFSGNWKAMALTLKETNLPLLPR